MRTPRKLKKQIKNAGVIMDVVSIPKYIQSHEWLALWKQAGVCIWDSSQGGDHPQIVGIKTKLKIRNENNNNKGRKSGSRV